MKATFEIKSHLGTVLFTHEGESLREAVVAAVKSRDTLSGATLYGANLSGANLSGADLYGANLGRANLSWATLTGANLGRANLYMADLGGADLDGANLGRANLYMADLGGADLGGAKLDDDTQIEPGLTWKQYQAEIVPALLTAGGRVLADVVNESWECHDWINCPMAVAYGVHDLGKIPALYRARAKQFIQFFDAKMIRKPGEAVREETR